MPATWELMRQMPNQPHGVEDELSARYTPGTGHAALSEHDQRNYTQRLLEDLGANDYTIHANDRANLRSYDPDDGGVTLGLFNDQTGRLEIDPTFTNSYDKSREVPAHEIAHFMDNTNDAYHPPVAFSMGHGFQEFNPGMHHEYYENFHKDFGNQLRSQREIEQGWGTDPSDLARYPWLNQVKPLSSNPIASPWKQNSRSDTQIPPDLWNMLTQEKRNQDDIQSAQVQERLKHPELYE